MDPLTIIVTALAAGAAAGLKPTAAQAMKDAYAGLKALIQRKYSAVNLDLLEGDPSSDMRKGVVKEDLTKTEAPQDPELLQQAQAVLNAVQKEAPQVAETVGVTLADIQAATLELENIIAQGDGTGGATGVRIKGADIQGSLTISGVTATNVPGTIQPPAHSASAATPPPITILFLAANPTDTTQLRLGQEVREIDDALRRAQYRDRFDLAQHHAVRVGDLQGLLQRHSPDIVHFSGHGSTAGEILLEDATGTMHPVTPRALSSTFALLKGRIRCVVLNACFSRIQAEAIAQHIECVIGMSTAITEAAAISFASAFYQALGYGQPLQKAFNLGLAQIDLENLGEQDTPQLIALNGDPGQVTFVSHQGGAHPNP